MASSIQFQLTSELTATIPTFTLTCTSTGGPATNVSWTVNSSAVTENSAHIITSLITNAATATYNNTLMVTGRLVGDYECTVSNSKSSSSSGIVTVVGKNNKGTDIFANFDVCRPPREYFHMLPTRLLFAPRLLASTLNPWPGW